MASEVVTIVTPGEGAGPFRFGMTRAEAWALTRSTVTSFFAQQWSDDRTDDVRDAAVHLDDADGTVQRIVAFTSNRPYAPRCAVIVEGSALGPDSNIDDVIALCDLVGWSWEREPETIDVAAVGVRFGFVEREGTSRLEWVAVAGGQDDGHSAGD